MRELIVGVGVVSAVFGALYIVFEPIFAPALAILLGALK